MIRQFTYTINKENEGMMIKAFLSAHNISKSCISALKRSDTGILVNGVKQFVTYQLKENDVLQIEIEETTKVNKILPTDISFDILYEDNDLLVINKPYGMPVHPSRTHVETSLANTVTYYYQQKGESIIFRCINRLDRDTTGLTIVAKNRISGALLSQAVSNREITRQYLAIVDGKLDQSDGIIDAPIERIGTSILRGVDFENGKKAITHYYVEHYDENKNVSLVRFQLETGRTHQIRVHMQYIGHPLIGDFLYNKSDSRMNRQALHATYIRFVHPTTKKEMEFTVPLPDDMNQFLNND